MSRIILLDAGPLGLLAQSRPTPASTQCRHWAQQLQATGALLLVTEIADYEVRRERVRASKRAGVQRLDALQRAFGYVALTTATMLQAAAFWAELRQQGRPTAGDRA